MKLAVIFMSSPFTDGNEVLVHHTSITTWI